jgi:phosphoribosylpyrophosphate synthetase
MHTCSIAPLFAEAIRRTHVGESISSLFTAGSRASARQG